MIVQLRLMEQACVRLLIYGARPRQGLKVRARLGRRRVAEFNNKTKRPKTASNLKCFQYNYLPTAVSPRQLKPQQLSSRLNLLGLGFLAQGLGPGPGARVWGLARCFRLCLRHSGAKYLPPRPRTCTDCGLQRSRHEAPTDGACFRSLPLGLVCRCLCRGGSGCAVYTVSRPYHQSLTTAAHTCPYSQARWSRVDVPTYATPSHDRGRNFIPPFHIEVCNLLMNKSDNTSPVSLAHRAPPT